MLKMTTVALLAATVSLPILAQTPAPPSRNPSQAALAAPATATQTATRPGMAINPPSARNSLMTDKGGMRASKIVGSSVYNDHDQKVGSIDDLVIASDKKTIDAVIPTSGKMVEVPFDKLEFGNRTRTIAW